MYLIFGSMPPAMRIAHHACYAEKNTIKPLLLRGHDDRIRKPVDDADTFRIAVRYKNSDRGGVALYPVPSALLEGRNLP